MFIEIIESLTNDQKRELQTRGIPQPRISDWKRGARLPTRKQALHLSEVTKISFSKLEKEITLLELPAEERQRFRKTLGGYANPVLLAILAMLASTQVLANIEYFGGNVHGQMIDRCTQCRK